jgi:hypothetical protein
VDDYLSQLPIKALPGIGHVLEEKLKKQNVWTCGQLRMISKVFYTTDISFLCMISKVFYTTDISFLCMISKVFYTTDISFLCMISIC